MSTSRKHKNFVSEPIGNKPVTELAGIGSVYGKQLEKNGFNKASVVLGHFLVMRKDKAKFTEWLKCITDANSKQANDCYQCLSEWSEQFI